jgi:hypothetical protein
MTISQGEILSPDARATEPERFATLGFDAAAGDLRLTR